MRPLITAVVIYKNEYYPRVFIVVQRIPIVVFFNFLLATFYIPPPHSLIIRTMKNDVRPTSQVGRL